MIPEPHPSLRFSVSRVSQARDSRPVSIRRALGAFWGSLLATVSFSGAARAEEAAPPGVPLPSLEQVLERAREHAPEVRAARAALGTSQATMVGARRPPLANPVITSFGEYGQSVTQPVYMESQLDLPIELWFQRKTRIAESQALSALSTASLEVARANALAAALESYAFVMLSQERSQVLRETINIAFSEAEVYRARTLLGDATERDARVAELEVARNQVLLAEARADLQLNLGTLHRLTAVRYAPPEASPLRPPWALAASGTNADALPSVVEASREADYHERVATRSKREAQMPFSLIARAAYGDSGEARFGAGFAFGIPIFQKNQGEVARAKASAEQSRVVAEASRAALEALLQGTGAELSELERAVETLEEVALPAAAAAVRASEEIQGAGKSDLLPVLMSRRDYAALRLRRLDILSRSWSALARVVRWKGVQP